MKLEEVAERLRISIKTLRRRIASGAIKAFKEGGRIRIWESDLEDYLAGKRQTPSWT